MLKKFLGQIFDKKSDGRRLVESSEDSSAKPTHKNINYIYRAWDGEKLFGLYTGMSLVDSMGDKNIPAVMHSLVVVDIENNPIRIFDADVLHYRNENYYVKRDPDAHDYPEGSEFVISSIERKKTYDIAILRGQSFKVVGNVFEGNYGFRLQHYLRDYKRKIFSSIALYPEFEWEEINDPWEEKLRKRNENNRRLDLYKVETLSGFFISSLFKNGLLNTGLCCPVCGLTPLSKLADWPYQKKWKNGEFLNVCKDCFDVITNE